MRLYFPKNTDGAMAARAGRRGRRQNQADALSRPRKKPAPVAKGEVGEQRALNEDACSLASAILALSKPKETVSLDDLEAERKKDDVGRVVNQAGLLLMALPEEREKEEEEPPPPSPPNKVKKKTKTKKRQHVKQDESEDDENLNEEEE